MIYTIKFQDRAYRINFEEGKTAEVEIEGEKLAVEFQKIDERLYSILIDNQSFNVSVLKKGNKLSVFLDGDLFEFEAVSERERLSGAGAAMSGAQQIKAPMPSRVVKILKSEGDEVKEGEGVIVVEAMKMESELKSPINGKIKEIRAKEGIAVESGTVLLVVFPDEASAASLE
ncbi:MAG: biotin/lipoyl-containing protein [Deltaproteobacteria bacterium]